jgi:hypothetical protein
MSYLVIDTDSAATDTYWDQLTQLDGREYLLRFRWMDRRSVWSLNIYDQDENPLALGIVLKVSWPLLRRFQDPRLPPGLLMCLDTSGKDLDPRAATDLGTRVILMYTTADDPDFQPGGALA